METQLKGKKVGNGQQQGTTTESVRLKVGEDDALQRIGTCLLEKVKGGVEGQMIEQPTEVLVSLFYSQEKGYVRIEKCGRNEDGRHQQARSTKERLIYPNIILSHAGKCPNFEFSHAKERFDLSTASYPTNSVSTCGMIVDCDNFVLFTKRSPEMRTYPRCWVLPGGQLDAGETFLQTLFREIKEEVGLNVQMKIQEAEIIIDDDDDQRIIDEELDEFNKSNFQNENIFKRKTRLQSKKLDQKKSGDFQSIPKINKKEIIATKGTIHLIDEPQALFLYESVYPTDIRINYPQRSSLVIFYILRISESFKDVQLSQSKSEIDYSAWIPLTLLYKIIDQKNFCDVEFLKGYVESGISINHNHFPIGLSCFVGIYPNNIGEGIGEAHVKAIRMLQRLSDQLKQ